MDTFDMVVSDMRKYMDDSTAMLVCDYLYMKPGTTLWDADPTWTEIMFIPCIHGWTSVVRHMMARGIRHSNACLSVARRNKHWPIYNLLTVKSEQQLGRCRMQHRTYTTCAICNGVRTWWP